MMSYLRRGLGSLPAAAIVFLVLLAILVAAPYILPPAVPRERPASTRDGRPCVAMIDGTQVGRWCAVLADGTGRIVISRAPP